jgi:MFS family permease
MIFLVNGLIVASWVSRIPAIQSGLALSPAQLGAALLVIAFGSLVSMPLTGALIHRTGSRAMVIVTTVAFCASLPPIALTGSLGSLAIALWFYGATGGAMDVAMNVEAAALERRIAKPIMSSFHGLFSLGGMAGSALGGAFAGAGVAPLAHFLVTAAAFGLMAALVFRWLPAGSSSGGPSLGFRFTRTLVILGAIAFCILVGEGAMADWSAIYLRNELGTGAGFAALGYAVFSGTMAAGRFAGDWLNLRFGPARLVRGGALLATGGLALALLAGGVPATLAGFACVGAGFSTIIPIVFGAGANVAGVAPGAGIAAVTTAGYLGFLTGPPIIGFTAEYAGLRVGLALVAVLSAAAALLGRAVKAE